MPREIENEYQKQSETCNMEIFNSGPCGKKASWKHPRYPTGYFCEGHKKELEKFFKNNWKRITS